MSEHTVDISWEHAPNPVAAETYSRNHQLSLNGGQQVQVSASVDYKGDPACADPEQLMIGALASCHMLTFLAIAEIQGFEVKRYEDKPVGHLEKGDSGRPEVTRIELQPRIEFSGDNQPSAEQLKRMHASAHKNCFIANSLKTKVEVLET